MVCKCNYEHTTKYSGWNEEYFDVIGLQELSRNNWKKLGRYNLPEVLTIRFVTVMLIIFLGSKIIKPGDLCGGLSEKAAQETGLISGTPVAAALIDAHAGGLGVMGCTSKNISCEFTSRLG